MQAGGERAARTIASFWSYVRFGSSSIAAFLHCTRACTAARTKAKEGKCVEWKLQRNRAFLFVRQGLLGPKKELWDILQSVEKYSYEAQDITASVRDLPTVRTHMGRARAWLRIALMQKKLADYLQALMEHKDEALAEYYEPHALMMSDEVCAGSVNCFVANR